MLAIPIPMMIESSPQAVDRLISESARTIEDIVSLDEFRSRLLSGRQLRFKFGVDVTAPTIHIGHAVNLWLYRALQELGHKVVFLIGDFTTQIGDPTGKSKTRLVIPQEEIDRNATAFIDQAMTVLINDPERVEVRRNSEWYGKMPTREFLALLSMMTHDRLAGRGMFKKRIEEGADIYMHEMVYPVLQGYDSVMLEADMTIVGSDQLYNEMVGRTYQEKFGQAPQVVVTTKVTPGIDGGEKQSKSLGNYIGLAHTPRDKFGRTMSIADELIRPYLEVYTTAPLDEIDTLCDARQTSPRDAKLQLATQIVSRYHGDELARAERDWFVRTFSQREAPEDIVEIHIGDAAPRAFDIVKKCLPDTQSNAALRRLFEQAAVRSGHDTIALDQLLTLPIVLKIGKRGWFRIVR